MIIRPMLTFDLGYALAGISLSAARQSEILALTPATRVAREVDPRLRADEFGDLLHRRAVGWKPRFFLRTRDERIPDELQQFARHIRGWQDVVRKSGRDDAPRHPFELCRTLVLHHHHAAGFLDRPDATSAVAARARERYSNRPFPTILCQRAEEKVHRKVWTIPGFEFAEQQLSVENLKALAGRNQINMVRLDDGAVLDLRHRHRRTPGKQFRHLTAVLRPQFLNNHKSHAAVAGHGIKETAQRLQSAGRSAQSRDKERGRRTLAFRLAEAHVLRGLIRFAFRFHGRSGPTGVLIERIVHLNAPGRIKSLYLNGSRGYSSRPVEAGRVTPACAKK